MEWEALWVHAVDRCGLFVSIGPAREFSSAECDAVKQFVHAGGTFLCMAGAQESRPIAPLLAEFGFTVPHSPVPPGDDAREPAPLGCKTTRAGQSDRQYPFHAAWPIECGQDGADKLSTWTNGKDEQSLIVSRKDGGGSVVVIGDTHFAGNENFQAKGRTSPDRVLFWRWLLSHVIPGQKPWNPPAGANAESSNTSEDDGDGTPE